MESPLFAEQWAGSTGGAANVPYLRLRRDFKCTHKCCWTLQCFHKLQLLKPFTSHRRPLTYVGDEKTSFHPEVRENSGAGSHVPHNSLTTRRILDGKISLPCVDWVNVVGIVGGHKAKLWKEINLQLEPRQGEFQSSVCSENGNYYQNPVKKKRLGDW